jgi:hypothetical protein
MAVQEKRTGCASGLCLSIATSIDPTGLLFPEIWSTFWYYVMLVWWVFSNKKSFDFFSLG